MNGKAAVEAASAVETAISSCFIAADEAVKAAQELRLQCEALSVEAGLGQVRMEQALTSAVEPAIGDIAQLLQTIVEVDIPRYNDAMARNRELRTRFESLGLQKRK
jgi:hypothetical protein